MRVFITCILLLFAACNSSKVERVAPHSEEGPDFGRTALWKAMTTFSVSKKTPIDYQRFVNRVQELTPLFNRSVQNEATLRLLTLAILPLEVGHSASPQQQVKMFATTLWPSIVEIPVLQEETPKTYVKRLCNTAFALDCNQVVPERWPDILQAKVWRALKIRLEVAYGHCHWCRDDPHFADIIERVRKYHVQAEVLARKALAQGKPSLWPVAGPLAAPLDSSLHVLSFQKGGGILWDGNILKQGDWRAFLRSSRGKATTLALHLRPTRFLVEFLALCDDIQKAGYQKIALVTRHANFPYQAMQYFVNAKHPDKHNLHHSDTIQVLVQALEYTKAKISE